MRLSNKLWENDKTKEKRYRLLGTVNYGKVNMWGKLMEDHDYFSRVCYPDLDQCLLHWKESTQD